MVNSWLKVTIVTYVGITVVTSQWQWSTETGEFYRTMIISLVLKDVKTIRVREEFLHLHLARRSSRLQTPVSQRERAPDERLTLTESMSCGVRGMYACDLREISARIGIGDRPTGSSDWRCLPLPLEAPDHLWARQWHIIKSAMREFF